MKKSAVRERGGGRRRPPQSQTERSPSVRFPCCRVLAWAALILAILLSGVLAVLPITDADIWWHLRTGEMVVTEGAVPHADPFTYIAQGRHWVTHEWLAEVVFYRLHRLGGINLLIVFKALLALAAMGLGAAAALVGPDRRNRAAPAALGVLLGGLVLADRAFARPAHVHRRLSGSDAAPTPT